MRSFVKKILFWKIAFLLAVFSLAAVLFFRSPVWSPVSRPAEVWGVFSDETSFDWNLIWGENLEEAPLESVYFFMRQHDPAGDLFQRKASLFSAHPFTEQMVDLFFTREVGEGLWASFKRRLYAFQMEWLWSPEKQIAFYWSNAHFTHEGKGLGLGIVDITGRAHLRLLSDFEWASIADWTPYPKEGFSFFEAGFLPVDILERVYHEVWLWRSFKNQAQLTAVNHPYNRDLLITALDRARNQEPRMELLDERESREFWRQFLDFVESLQNRRFVRPSRMDRYFREREEERPESLRQPFLQP